MVGRSGAPSGHVVGPLGRLGARTVPRRPPGPEAARQRRLSRAGGRPRDVCPQTPLNGGARLPYPGDHDGWIKVHGHRLRFSVRAGMGTPCCWSTASAPVWERGTSSGRAWRCRPSPSICRVRQVETHRRPVPHARYRSDGGRAPGQLGLPNRRRPRSLTGRGNRPATGLSGPAPGPAPGAGLDELRTRLTPGPSGGLAESSRALEGCHRDRWPAPGLAPTGAAAAMTRPG